MSDPAVLKLQRLESENLDLETKLIDAKLTIRELVEALEQARIFVADLPIVGDETLKKVDAALAKAKQTI